jgi:hypothetical protein
VVMKINQMVDFDRAKAIRRIARSSSGQNMSGTDRPQDSPRQGNLSARLTVPEPALAFQLEHDISLDRFTAGTPFGPREDGSGAVTLLVPVPAQWLGTSAFGHLPALHADQNRGRQGNPQPFFLKLEYVSFLRIRPPSSRTYSRFPSRSLQTSVPPEGQRISTSVTTLASARPKWTRRSLAE